MNKAQTEQLHATPRTICNEVISSLSSPPVCLFIPLFTNSRFLKGKKKWKKEIRHFKNQRERLARARKTSHQTRRPLKYTARASLDT
jgi:hypothetical protein